MTLPRIADDSPALESSPEFPALSHDPAITAAAQSSDLPYDQTIDLFLTGYAHRPALGERSYRARVDSTTGDTIRDYQAGYRTITYKELQARVKALSMAWRDDPKCSVQRGDFVCVIGFASVDYALIDLALAYTKAIPVPLSSHHSLAELEEILLHTNAKALAVAVAHLPAFVDLALRVPSLKSLIVFDYDPDITREQSVVEEARAKVHQSRGDLQLMALQDLIDRGHADSFEFLPTNDRENEDTVLLIHTSGSTGRPKGACISEKALLNTWKNVFTLHPKVTVVLAPFNHMMGRDSMYTALNSGGTAYFTLKADMSTLLEDIRLIRPTSLTLFPRICEMIYDYFQNAISENPAVESTKSSLLGDRLQSVTVASAPILPKIKNFIADSFQVPVHEGYSSTETASGGLAMDGHLNRANVTEYKLRDVPESGYYSTDRPYPRGELCVKTRFGIKQYYKNPSATAGLFDEEGFCCTGDIVEERGPNQIAIIDRRKDVLKLSQGEFVAIGKLGKLFEQGSALIHQLFVHGDGCRSYLLAVVVPNFHTIGQMQQPPATQDDLKSLLKNEIHRVAQENGLRNFEIPRDIIVADEPFTQKNGLLSSVDKYLRPAIRSRYREALEALYATHEDIRHNELAAFNLQKSSLSIEERLLALLSTTLGVHCGDEAGALAFQELGGDSLGAVLLFVLIEKEFGVCIKGDQILSPQGNVREWAKCIRNAQKDTLHPVTFESIHGSDPREILAADLQLSRFIGEDILTGASSLARPPQRATTILLSGANGFLGGRVCLKWLETLAGSDGKLICLVRPSTTKSARERLDERFARHDPGIADHYRRLAGQHLQIVPGDVSEPFLGLDFATYERLAREVDAVCHCAALVNHLLEYEHLFRPNVIGTAEIIRFAMTSKRKCIDFVSTVGVQSLTDRSRGNTESTPLLPHVPLGKSYALGYFTSKWAGEHLLRSAHDQTGIPVNVIRPNLIMPDRHLAGEVNKDDILSRLIYSIVLTGLAPESFDDPTRSEAGFQVDGLPVDLLADAIVRLSELPSTGFRVFNTAHTSTNAFSLDALLNCMESAGYPLRRIPNYGDWMDRMVKALGALPPDQRSQSILHVMEAYSQERPAEPRAASGDAFRDLIASNRQGPSDPLFSEQYNRKYLRDLVALGLPPTPAAIV